MGPRLSQRARRHLDPYPSCFGPDERLSDKPRRHEGTEVSVPPWPVRFNHTRNLLRRSLQDGEARRPVPLRRGWITLTPSALAVDWWEADLATAAGSALALASDRAPAAAPEDGVSSS